MSNELQEVRGVLAAIVGAEVISGIQDDDLIFEHRIVDSLHLVDLMERLEATFRTEVAPDDLTAENFGSIAAISAYFGR